ALQSILQNLARDIQATGLDLEPQVRTRHQRAPKNPARSYLFHPCRFLDLRQPCHGSLQRSRRVGQKRARQRPTIPRNTSASGSLPASTKRTTTRKRSTANFGKSCRQRHLNPPAAFFS